MVIYQLLEKIHRSYNECLGNKSLNLLKCYLDGFRTVVRFHDEMPCDLLHGSTAGETPKFNDEFAVIGDFFSDFQEWIEQKYSCNLSQSWCNILRFCTNNEEEAFELFYNELDQFCKSGYSEKNMMAKQVNHNTDYYRNVHVLGEDIDFIKFKNEQYNNMFYWKLWKILIMIKRTPVLIIGEKSLSLVRVFLNGFIDAYNTIYADNLYEFFPGFEEWINEKKGLFMYRPWHKVILFLSTSEGEAFDSFFVYLEEYIMNYSSGQ